MTRGSVPFLGLCGPRVGKSVVGYEILQQVCRSGIKASFMDFDQLGLCYPAPDDDPVSHRVKAHNLAAVCPVYRAAGARCLIAVGGFADLCIDADNRNVAQVARHIRTRTGGWPLLIP